MYAMNIQNDVIGLVLRQNCKSKQVTDFIAWQSRCHVRIHAITWEKNDILSKWLMTITYTLYASDVWPWYLL